MDKDFHASELAKSKTIPCLAFADGLPIGRIGPSGCERLNDYGNEEFTAHASGRAVRKLLPVAQTIPLPAV